MLADEMDDEFLTAVKEVMADATARPRLNDLLNAEAGCVVTDAPAVLRGPAFLSSWLDLTCLGD
jgi:hypothetical protein